MNARTDMTRATALLVVLLIPSLAYSAQTAILDDALPAQDAKITASLRQSLFDAGEQTLTLKAADLNDPKKLAAAEMLVLPSARSVPLAALPAIEQFLQSGGKLIACGLPLGEEGVFQADGKWMTRREYEDAVARVRPAQMLA